MNKSNKILLGVLSFVVVCVVGYALFSENITVTGTATAEGDFSIKTTCQTGLSSEVVLPAENLKHYTLDGGYTNDSCSVSGSNISLKVNLLYPSAERVFTIKVENTGSIDAIFDLSESDEEGGFSNTNVTACEINSNNQKVNCGSSISYSGENGTGSFEPAIFSILGGKDANGTYYHPYTGGGFEGKFADETYGYVLKPGQSFYYAITIRWSDHYDNLSNSANYSIDLSTKLKFVQVH